MAEQQEKRHPGQPKKPEEEQRKPFMQLKCNGAEAKAIEANVAAFGYKTKGKYVREVCVDVRKFALRMMLGGQGLEDAVFETDDKICQIIRKGSGKYDVSHTNKETGKSFAVKSITFDQLIDHLVDNGYSPEHCRKFLK